MFAVDNKQLRTYSRVMLQIVKIMKK